MIRICCTDGANAVLTGDKHLIHQMGPIVQRAAAGSEMMAGPCTVATHHCLQRVAHELLSNNWHKTEQHALR